MKKIIAIITMLFTFYAISYASDCREECLGTKVVLSTLANEYEGDRIMATDLGLWYKFQFGDFSVTPYTFINTWFIQNDEKLWRGMPFNDIYYLGVDASYKGFGINVDHYCSHSVWSGKDQWLKYNETYVKEEHLIHTLGSDSSTVSLNYTLDYSYLTLFVSGGFVLESDSYFTINKLNIQIPVMDWCFINIYAKYSYWTNSDRQAYTFGATLSLIDKINFNVEYYHTNKERDWTDPVAERNYEYNENPLVSKSIIFSIGYQFN